MVKTTQDEFHPLRGHMEDGAEIVMRNGTTLVLRAVMSGWQLYDKQGREFGSPTASAHDIASLVTSYSGRSDD